MSPVDLAVVSFVAVLVSFGVSMLLVRTAHRHQPSLDTTWSGPQKIHLNPVPRIGGVSIAVGLVVAALIATAIRGETRHFWLLLACVVPGFAWGLIEDLSKNGAVFARLAFTGCSAMLAFVLLDARITELGVPLLDAMLTAPAFSFVFTVVAVAGVGHAMNVIDGLNGLAGATTLLAALGFGVVAWIVGDGLIFAVSCALAASVLGFLVFNFPRGRLFLGDGGAYLIGLLLAELSVLLVQRNPAVSPWFPLVLLAYPIWETLFTICRRLKRRVSSGRADGLHLHSLVYRRIVRRTGHYGILAHSAQRNSIASLMLWVLPFVSLIAAVALWNRTIPLQLAALGFAALYITLYRRIVRFGVPNGFVVHLAPGARGAAGAGYSTARG